MNQHTKKLQLSTLALVLLAGCATQPGSQSSTGQIDHKATSAGAGSAIGCIGGAVLAKLAGGKALAGCAAGAVVGGLIGFEKARQEEIMAARKAQEDAIAEVNGAKANPVVTEEVQVRDKTTGETKRIQAVKEVSIDLPLSQKHTPEFDAAMDKIKKLAEKYADERGAAQITLALNPKDAKQQKVSEQRVFLKSASGKGEIIFVRAIDSLIPTGYERVTVTAKNNASNVI